MEVMKGDQYKWYRRSQVENKDMAEVWGQWPQNELHKMNGI